MNDIFRFQQGIKHADKIIHDMEIYLTDLEQEKARLCLDETACKIIDELVLLTKLDLDLMQQNRVLWSEISACYEKKDYPAKRGTDD